MFAPSLGDLSGSGWVSVNNPSAPSAMAARAKGSTIARFPTRRSTKTARLLYAVGRIKNHGHTQVLHLGNRPHVVHQSTITKKCSPFTKQDIFAAGISQFGYDVLHVAWGHELGLFDIYRFACAGRCNQKICLAREKRGYLQQVADLARPRQPVTIRGCRS